MDILGNTKTTCLKWLSTNFHSILLHTISGGRVGNDEFRYVYLFSETC